MSAFAHSNYDPSLTVLTRLILQILRQLLPRTCLLNFLLDILAFSVDVASSSDRCPLPVSSQIWETYADGTALWGKVSPEGHADIVQQLVNLDEQGENEVPFIVTDGKAKRAPKDLVYVSDW